MIEAKILERYHDRPASLDNPKTPRIKPQGNFEKYAWIFMRFSGIILILLAFGHLFIMLGWDEGVHRIDAEFVKARWKQPFWQLWDITMLWLAQLHGGNGLRVIISDYTRKGSTRFWLNTLLIIAMILIAGLGSYALLTF